jgi:hypothetical protein
MPDLDVIYIQVCANEVITEEVPSSRGTGVYMVTASLDESLEQCNCDGFRYRRKCRHVEALRSKLCGWNQQIDEEQQTPQQEMEGVCPRCGGETRVVRWAV